MDPALLRPGRLDRKVEFGLPDLESRTQIFKIHTRSMAVERDIRYELLSRLCPNATGAEIHSVCTEAGMFAIRQRRKTVNEKVSDSQLQIPPPCLPILVPEGTSYLCPDCLSIHHDIQG